MTEHEGSQVRLVVVDDHEFAREAVAAMLDAEPGLKIVGQAGTVLEALEVIGRLVPDVAVLDLRLPDGSGRELLEHFAVALPELRSVVFTSSVELHQTEALVEAGAAAVILKSLRGTDLVDAIRRAGNHDGDSQRSA